VARRVSVSERREDVDESRIMRQMQASQPINITRTMDPVMEIAF
jgi:hypothetical protein